MERPLDHGLIELVIVGHHQHRGAAQREGQRGPDLRVVVVSVDDADGGGRLAGAFGERRRREEGQARGIGGGRARVAEGDAEARCREERSGEGADVASADDEGVSERLQGLDEQIDRAAAAHAERGAEAEGLQAGSRLAIEQRLQHAGEHDALHGAAADGAHGRALVQEHQLLPRGRGRGAVAGDDRGQHHAGAPIEGVERRAEDLVRERRAREDGRGVAHERGEGSREMKKLRVSGALR